MKSCPDFRPPPSCDRPDGCKEKELKKQEACPEHEVPFCCIPHTAWFNICNLFPLKKCGAISSPQLIREMLSLRYVCGSPNSFQLLALVFPRIAIEEGKHYFVFPYWVKNRDCCQFGQGWIKSIHPGRRSSCISRMQVGPQPPGPLSSCQPYKTEAASLRGCEGLAWACCKFHEASAQ